MTALSKVAKVTKVYTDVVYKNPFKNTSSKGPKATCRILENITQDIFEEETEMTIGYKVVEVKHLNSKRTGLYATDILDIAVGDLVVYESAIAYDGKPAGEMALHTGTVVNVSPGATVATHYIVCKIDLTAYKKRKECAEQISKIRQALNAKKKMYQDMELLNLIAERDPATKALLDEYLELTRGCN